jgi:hypothetical protein
VQDHLKVRFAKIVRNAALAAVAGFVTRQGENVWAHGYCVSNVGPEEEAMVRTILREQGK